MNLDIRIEQMPFSIPLSKTSGNYGSTMVIYAFLLGDIACIVLKRKILFFSGEISLYKNNRVIGCNSGPIIYMFPAE